MPAKLFDILTTGLARNRRVDNGLRLNLPRPVFGSTMTSSVGPVIFQGREAPAFRPLHLHVVQALHKRHATCDLRTSRTGNTASGRSCWC